MIRSLRLLRLSTARSLCPIDFAYLVLLLQHVLLLTLHIPIFAIDRDTGAARLAINGEINRRRLTLSPRVEEVENVFTSLFFMHVIKHVSNMNGHIEHNCAGSQLVWPFANILQNHASHIDPN